MHVSELSPSGVLSSFFFFFFCFPHPSEINVRLHAVVENGLRPQLGQKALICKKDSQLKASNTSSHNKILIGVLYKIKRKASEAFTKGSWYAHIKVNAFFQQINHIYYSKFILRRNKTQCLAMVQRTLIYHRFYSSSFFHSCVSPYMSFIFYRSSFVVCGKSERHACKSFSCTMTFRTLERLFVLKGKNATPDDCISLVHLD